MGVCCPTTQDKLLRYETTSNKVFMSSFGAIDFVYYIGSHLGSGMWASHHAVWQQARWQHTAHTGMGGFWSRFQGEDWSPPAWRLAEPAHRWETQSEERRKAHGKKVSKDMMQEWQARTSSCHTAKKFFFKRVFGACSLLMALSIFILLKAKIVSHN